MSDAMREGFEAGQSGEDLGMNPYDDLMEEDSYNAWTSGWEDAREEGKRQGDALSAEIDEYLKEEEARERQ